MSPMVAPLPVFSPATNHTTLVPPRRAPAALGPRAYRPGCYSGIVCAVRRAALAPPNGGTCMQNTAEVGRTRPLEGVRVLVVEDYADSRALFALLLKLSGAAVVAVGSGDEAVAALELDRFDALVSDIHMPGMSGLALIRKVRAWPEVGA